MIDLSVRVRVRLRFTNSRVMVIGTNPNDVSYCVWLEIEFVTLTIHTNRRHITCGIYNTCRQWMVMVTVLDRQV